jgi:oxygen-dependent protoporphyrinogen oxidase
MSRALGREIQRRTRVERIAPVSGGWAIYATGPSGPTRQLFDAVICAVPSHATGSIVFEGKGRAAWNSLAAIRYNPVAVVVSGFERGQVAHPLDGFGVLVPGVEKLRTLGTLFSSALFPERAPAGFVTLTTFVGGARQPEIALGGESRVAEAVQQDLIQLLGVRSAPVFRMVQVWPQAIPQYNLGYGEFKEKMDMLERDNPGLFLAGSYRNGVAVGEVMTSGALAADAAGLAGVQRGELTAGPA